MSSIRKTLAQYDIRPRKRLGQSFLEDINVIRRIAALADPSAQDIVVEIGAGLGFLTAELARKAGKVVALEFDPRLIAVLQDRFSRDDRVEIVPGDALDYVYSSASAGARIKVVGNLPYNISSPILFRLLEFRRTISSMVLMFQKELADRIMAPPGKKDYGIPSVMVARYATSTREMNVPSTCFYPEPAVTSSVLRIVMREDEVPPEEELLFSLTVRAAFARRRKTLWNNLRAAGFADETLETVLANARIDGIRRGETLSVEEFGRLASALAAAAEARKILDKRRGF
ncbi:MAG: 16S rRNA (adenine(1518)-N(6)/adenine(1519)-N(6))-dimethyltransferase RsmA [Syntrophales bacterium]